MKYRNVLEIEAEQYNGPESLPEDTPIDKFPALPRGVRWSLLGLEAFDVRRFTPVKLRWFPTCNTLEAQKLKISPGDWICGPGSEGEYWPVKDVAFRKRYVSIQ